MFYSSRWRLNKDHNLEITVNDTVNGTEEITTLKSEIVNASSDELVFLITSKKENNIEVTSLLKLSGKWQADEFNRLTFLASKANGEKDVLVFGGAWKAGKNNEIIYRYRKTQLKRKTKKEHFFVLDGRWSISAKDRLAYTLDTSGESEFLFKAQFESTGASRELGCLRYKVGIGVDEGKRPVERVIKFFGVLRLNVAKNTQVELELTSAAGKRLGASFMLERKILGGEAFLRLKRMARDSRVEAGVRIPW